jgi:hypothetical protein
VLVGSPKASGLSLTLGAAALLLLSLKQSS